MNATKQSLGLFFTLLLLAGSGWYFVNMENSSKLDNETLATSIDATITQLTVSQYNSEGMLANFLTTPLMEHIPRDDIHLLTSPYIIISQKDQPSWEIRAEKAKSLHGGEKIIFNNKVVVHQNAGENTQESTLKTEEVIYFPKDKKASTDLFVTFEQPGNIIQSTGMNAYLDEKRVELLHQARGSYVPNKG